MAESKMAVKIAALFAKARAEGATAAESEAFAAKAHELMMLYAVEEAEVAAAGGAPNEIVTQQAYLLGKLSPQSLRSVSLASALALANGLYLFYEEDIYKEEFKARVTVIHFTGKKVACSGAIALWGALQTDMLSQAANVGAYYGHPDWDDRMSKAANTKNMRVSFLDGFVASVTVRLKEMQVKVEQDSGMSLHPVLVSDRTRAKEHLTEQGLSFRAGRQASAGRAHSSMQAGREAGSRANLAKSSIQPRKTLGTA